MSTVYGWSFVGVLCTCAAAWGQAPGNPPRTGERPAPTANAGAVLPGHGTANQEIAACLWGKAHNEVEISKIAQQRAQSDAVKEFAAQMIKDHSQQADKLGRLAGQFLSASPNQGAGGIEFRRDVVRTPANPAGRADDRKDAREAAREDAGTAPRDEARTTTNREQRREAREATREDRAGGREVRSSTTIAAGKPGLNWVAIHREINEQCLASATKELTSKSGREFDMCYMGLQVVGHMQMLDTLQVLKNYATGELQQELEQGITTTEQHLTQARQIVEQFKNTSTTAQGAGTTQVDDASGRNRPVK